MAIVIDRRYLQQQLTNMLAIPCPTGYTEAISVYVAQQLAELNISHYLTRRGTLVAKLAGKNNQQGRAVANHLDTIGAVVSAIRPNGRPALQPVGCWSSRFAEGGRVTLFSQHGTYRGQVLPLLASGHAFNEQVDRLPVAWNQLELRLDEPVFTAQDTLSLGIAPGDFVAFDSDPEFAASGYISARHLDNKAGAAALLSALKYLQQQGIQPAMDFYALFTITEEVGTGAGASLHPQISEFVGIDIGPVAQGQNAKETGVTLCALDTSGPYDIQLTHKLRDLCRQYAIDYQMDVYRYYYSDANSAITAGHDIRTGLITFGTDATHGYERTHIHSLDSISQLLVAYATSEPCQ